jgi:hypothetical protein
LFSNENKLIINLSFQETDLNYKNEDGRKRKNSIGGKIRRLLNVSGKTREFSWVQFQQIPILKVAEQKLNKLQLK